MYRDFLGPATFGGPKPKSAHGHSTNLIWWSPFTSVGNCDVCFDGELPSIKPSNNLLTFLNDRLVLISLVIQIRGHFSGWINPTVLKQFQLSNFILSSKQNDIGGILGIFYLCIDNNTNKCFLQMSQVMSLVDPTWQSRNNSVDDTWLSLHFGNATKACATQGTSCNVLITSSSLYT